MVAGTRGSLTRKGPMKTRENSILSAGIDTGKDKLDVAIPGTAKSFVVENSPNGWQVLAARFAAAGVNRIGIEATGGYERGLTRHLHAQGFTVLVLQPLQVRAFAQLRLQRAKHALGLDPRERPHRRRADCRLRTFARSGARSGQQAAARSAVRCAGGSPDLHRADRGRHHPHQDAYRAYPRSAAAAHRRGRLQAPGAAT